MLTPHQVLQQWIGNPSHCQSHDDSAWSLTSTMVSARKASCGPFLVPSDGRAAARAYRVARYKTARQWAKIKAEDSFVGVFVAAPARAKDIATAFNELAEAWDRETAHLSSPLQKMMHPSYHAILGMSAESPEDKRQIIRLLLHDLKTNHRDWFLMLSYLTQQNPINPKDSGKTSKMIASWLTWGEKQGLL